MNIIVAILLMFLTTASAQKVINVNHIALTNAVTKQQVSLSEYQNSRAIAIIFTSNYCPYSKLYEDRIEKLAASYADKGIQFVLVNSNNPAASKDDSLEEMAKKANSRSFSFPYLADKEQKLQLALGASKTPEVFLVRPQSNEFQVIYSGAIDNNPQVEKDVSKHYLKDAIENVLKGKEIQVKNIRTTGCMIKKN